MCRLLAYLGDEIFLSQLLLNPQHSLEKQSWQPQELNEAVLNADGFGFTWYNHTNGQSTAECYRSVLPIWNDPNLKAISNTIEKPLWLAAVRSATPGLGVTLQNTQPFHHKQWMFLHNGYLLDFAGATQHAMRDLLEDEYLFLINGNTDSEYIFALLMQCLASKEPIAAIQQCLDSITAVIGTKRALLNIMLTDGETIYATRHAINGICPSLYYTNNSNEFGMNNQLIVSEPLNSEDCWISIQEHSITSISKQDELKIISL